MTEMRIIRAGKAEREQAFALVEEYNTAVNVLVRDSPESFARDYFGTGSGLWLAYVRARLAGCIALRPLPTRPQAGEIKRLYVRPEFRATGVSGALLAVLELYAAESGYHQLFLDSKEDLKAALRFYERHGYEPCPRYNENAQATVFLQKSLARA